jgi:peptidoglycan/LPS O-acetylase OafA/YrhL
MALFGVWRSKFSFMAFVFWRLPGFGYWIYGFHFRDSSGICGKLSLSHWASAMLTYICFLLCGTAYYYNYRGLLSLTETFAIQGFLFLCFAIGLRIGLLAVSWSMVACHFLAYVAFATAYFSREWVAALPTWITFSLGLLADISYPLYTVHGVLGYTLIGHLLAGGASSGVAIGLAVCCVLLGAFAIHRLVEMPTRSLGRLAALSITTQNLELQS